LGPKIICPDKPIIKATYLIFAGKQFIQLAVLRSHNVIRGQWFIHEKVGNEAINSSLMKNMPEILEE
jgi:hypothetical protein